MRNDPTRLILTVLLLAGLSAVLLRVAWVGDDALISLRSVHHWSLGYGPNWNVAERVQTYTHPLWFLLLAATHAVTGEFFYGTIALSLLFALVAAWLLLRLASTSWLIVLTAVLLAGSAGFFNFATSGLENPLTFALLATLATISLHPDLPAERRLLLASLVTGLGMITRMDLLLLCGPTVLWSLRGMPLKRSIPIAVIGSSPFLLWSLFATVYYGSMFPITAYAKLNTGVETSDLLAQGLHYVAYVAKYDPLTLLTLLLGVALGLRAQRGSTVPLALGVLFYCAYIIKVGGDFMGSRFASVPFIVALALLLDGLRHVTPNWQKGAIAVGLLLWFVPGVPAWMMSPAEDLPPSNPLARMAQENGIVDERCFYYEQLGMLAPTLRIPQAGVASDELRRLGRQAPVVFAEGQVGRKGFEAGDRVHRVDPWLCEPLLLRLPIGSDQWRIGHFIRAMPTGYLETVARPDQPVQLHHEGLGRYYENLRTAIRAPLFSGERLAALWRVWTGAYDDDLRDYIASDYRNPPRIQIPFDQLKDPVESGRWWFDDPRVRVIYRGGVRILFDRPQTARSLTAWLQMDKDHRFTFLLDGEPQGHCIVDTELLPIQGQQPHAVAVPADVTSFDAIDIDVQKLYSHDVPAIGGLRLDS